MPLLNPLTLGIAALVLPKVVDMLTAGGGQRSRKFSPIEAARFTRLEDGARHFDADLSSKLPGILSTRSAVLEPQSPQAPDARVWKIVPLKRGLPVAAGVIKHGRSQGWDVYGSLSLAYLLSSKDVPMVLVTAPTGMSAELAGTQSQLALIDPPPPPVIVETAPEATATSSSNGVANGGADKPRTVVEQQAKA